MNIQGSPLACSFFNDLSVAVHLFVVMLVLARDDRLPPGLVVEIPLDGFLNAVGESGLRQPAQLIVDLGGVDGVAHVVALAVGHKGDQRLGLSQRVADELYDIEILHLVVAAHVVDLALGALADDEIDRAAVILDIQPVAHILARSVDRQRLVVQRVCDHERDKLLREVIGAVVVGAARDGDRQSVGAVICADQEVC